MSAGNKIYSETFSIFGYDKNSHENLPLGPGFLIGALENSVITRILID